MNTHDIKHYRARHPKQQSTLLCAVEMRERLVFDALEDNRYNMNISM